MEAEAPLDLRVNLLKSERDAAIDAAWPARGSRRRRRRFSPWGLRLPARRPVTGTAAFRKGGLVEVQDEGSQLIALLADARPGMRVCDLLRRRGRQDAGDGRDDGQRASITACDISAARLEGAAQRLRRAGVDNAERHLLEAGDNWAKRRAGSVRPGAGGCALHRAPAPGGATPMRGCGPAAEDLAELVDKQHEILVMASELVRPGGRLVYATCSLLPRGG